MPTFKVDVVNGQEAERSRQLVIFQRQEHLPADPQTLAWRALPDLARSAEPFAYELALDLQVSASGSLVGAAALPGRGPVGGGASLLGPFGPGAQPGAGFGGAPGVLCDSRGAGLFAPELRSGLGYGYGPGACLPGTPASLAGPVYTLELLPGAPAAVAAAAGGGGDLPRLASTSGSHGSHGGRCGDGGGGDGGDTGSDSTG